MRLLLALVFVGLFLGSSVGASSFPATAPTSRGGTLRGLMTTAPGFPSLRPAAPAIARTPAEPAAVVSSGVPLTLPGAAAQFGSSVAVAGDVNGDGYSDLIVGAPDYTNGETSEGEILVFLGGPAGYAPTPAWTFESDVAGGLLGWSVGPAGDVNGDGYGDVIAGAPGVSSNLLTNNGRAYVFLGGAAGLAATPAWTLDGDQGGQLFGWSVCTAGDVDGDGYDDVIVGSPGYYNIASPQDRPRPASVGSARTQTAFIFNNGRAQVFLGGSTGLAVTPQWDRAGSQAGGAFGYSVSTAHDVNGDGYDDVVVGMPYGEDLLVTPGLPDAGEFEVYEGSASGLPLASASLYYGTAMNDLVGFSVAGIGDVDGDGYADVAVGSPGYSSATISQGAVYVYRGGASGLLDWDFFDEGPAVSSPGAQFGFSVAPAGDVNGDGHADFVVGGPFYATALPYLQGAGYVALYQGSPVNGGTANTAYARLAFSAVGDLSNIESGYSVCAAGDEDGDGFGDVVIGAPTSNANDGQVSLLRGAADLPQNSPGRIDTTMYSGVIAIGDVNGDGYDDLAAIAPWDAGNVQSFVQFFFGGPDGPPTTPSQTIPASTIDGDPQAWVASGAGWDRGDIDGDGYDDVIVETSDGTSNRYAVLPGGPSGVGATPMWLTAAATNSPSVEPAGDVNGDGFSDVFYADDTHIELHLGSPTGVDPTPAWTVTDSYPYGEPLGDINGDGYEDVGILKNGSVDLDIFMGNASGLPATPASTVTSAYNAHCLGDINGDGYADYFYGLNTVTTIAYGNDALPPQLLLLGSGWVSYVAGGAGDVDGDGYDDLVVDGEFNGVATVAVIKGSASGLQSSIAWSWQTGPTFGFNNVSIPADLNGDGFADVTYLTQNTSLKSFNMTFYGNGSITGLPGVALRARQRRDTDTAPISLGGLTNSATDFRVAAIGRSPAGRARVRLGTDVKSWAIPYETDLGHLVSDPWTLTGAPGASGSTTAIDGERALPASAAQIKWRGRIATHSPYFPGSPWFEEQPAGGRALTAMRVGGAVTAVAPPRVPTVLALDPPSPNPSNGETRLSFDLPRRESVDLAVYDLAGRRIVTLASGETSAGEHQAVWKERVASGRALGAGIYFARLVANGQRRIEKIVVAR